MRQKTLIALAVVTVPVLLAAIFVPAPGGSASKPVEAGPVFPTLKDWLGKATKLTITSADGTINLVRQAAAHVQPAADDVPAAGWTLADKGGYPVQETVVRQLLAGMLKLRETESKTERPKLYGRLDLADPSADKSSKGHLIELADANGASIVKLIVGRRKYDPSGTGADSIYVRKPDEARSWAAQPAFDVPSEASSWIDRKILDVEPDKVQSVTLTETGGKPLALARGKADDKLDIKDLPKDAKLKSDNPGSEIAAAFRYLDLLDVRPAAQVTAAPSSTVELTTFDGLDVSIAIAEQDGAGWLKLTAKGSGDAAKNAEEIAKRTQGWAYKVPETREKTLETKLADLVQPPAAPAPTPTAAATPPAKGRKGN